MKIESILSVVFGASWRTTLIGYLGSAFIELGLALDKIPTGGGKYVVAWHIAAVLVAAFGRAVKDGAVTGGTAPATKEAASRTQQGFIVLGFALRVFLTCVAIIAIIGLVAPALARGQEGPKFGGCWNNGSSCAGPTVSVNVLEIKLKTGDVTTQFSPGVGYGITFRARDWYKYGFSGNFALKGTAAGQKPQVSLLASFAEYLRVGLTGLAGAGNFLDTLGLLVSFGTDVGATPSPAG